MKGRARDCAGKGGLRGDKQASKKPEREAIDTECADSCSVATRRGKLASASNCCGHRHEKSATRWSTEKRRWAWLPSLHMGKGPMPDPGRPRGLRECRTAASLFLISVKEAGRTADMERASTRCQYPGGLAQ